MEQPDESLNDSLRPMPAPRHASGKPGHPEPVTLGQFATEITATFAANMLRESGIRCELVGGASSGFKAETPGYVRLLVSQHDEAMARELLEEFNAQKAPDDTQDDSD